MLAMQDSEGRRRRFSMPFLVSPNVSRLIHLIFIRLFVHWIHFKYVELEGCLALDVNFTSVRLCPDLMKCWKKHGKEISELSK